jgi:hypothetical protein
MVTPGPSGSVVFMIGAMSAEAIHDFTFTPVRAWFHSQFL